MVFSDTSGLTGIIQRCEFLTNLGSGTISGDTTLLKQFTANINWGFERIMPKVLSFSEYAKFDDPNNADLPIATFTVNSGQQSYQFSQDDNSLDILNITNVSILQPSSATEYTELEMMDIDDPRAIKALSSSSATTGIPTAWLKRGNTIFFNIRPTTGTTGKIYFERQQAYFTTADTNQKPGIPLPFHSLLPLYASRDWLLVNKPGNQELISRIEGEIGKEEVALERATNKLFPKKSQMRAMSQDSK